VAAMAADLAWTLLIGCALVLTAILAPIGVWDAARRGRIDRSLVRLPAFPGVLGVACLLSFLTWTAGYLHSSDGPCDAVTTMGMFRGKSETRLLPPGQRCVGFDHGGTQVGTSPWFPRPAEYGYAVLMFIVPFAVWGGARRVRRAVERVGPRHGQAE
jgi:hypothetical protein